VARVVVSMMHIKKRSSSNKTKAALLPLIALRIATVDVLPLIYLL
jgi:hypothetical protein